VGNEQVNNNKTMQTQKCKKQTQYKWIVAKNVYKKQKNRNLNNK
jgi:hypothetical protein